MRRFLILTLLLATAACSSTGQGPPEVARSVPPAEAPPAAEKGGSAPAPALVLIGLAVGAALMVALISNTAMMPDTAP